MNHIDGCKINESCTECYYKRVKPNPDCTCADCKPILYGDVDGDGKIDAADITLLRRYIAANDKPAFLLANPRFNLENARVTGHSGDPNAADVARLRQYVAGFDVELGK
jgi:hypothetical protein